MSRIVELLQKGPTLIMSLPANDPDLARAAMGGGADALKVHIRVHHEASGTHFGTLEEERKKLEEIVSIFPGPVGIVAGAQDPATRQEMAELRRMGIDFFDLYASHMPAWMWRIQGMGKAVALESTYSVHQAIALESLGADLIEAAIIPHEGYGKPLTLADLAAYRDLHDTVDIPIIVPTQRAILPEEAGLITNECGIEGLMIGAIVTGRTALEIELAVKQFKAALKG
ncbi:MAG: hypothetical protein ACYDBB_20545 [Armatimonadota bacterium]